MQACKVWIGARFCIVHSMQKQAGVHICHQTATSTMLQVLKPCCEKRDQPKQSSFLPSRYCATPPPPQTHPHPPEPLAPTCFPLDSVKEHGLKDAACLQTSKTHSLCAFLSRVSLKGKYLPHMYLAHHELESVIIFIIIIVVKGLVD